MVVVPAEMDWLNKRVLLARLRRPRLASPAELASLEPWTRNELTRHD